jgi:hypothetical protein
VTVDFTDLTTTSADPQAQPVDTVSLAGPTIVTKLGSRPTAAAKPAVVFKEEFQKRIGIELPVSATLPETATVIVVTALPNYYSSGVVLSPDAYRIFSEDQSDRTLLWIVGLDTDVRFVLDRTLQAPLCREFFDCG